MSESLLTPQWPAPVSVRACQTTRLGGLSLPPYESLNLGEHVGDAPEAVAQNRARLRQLAGLPSEPLWLQQVHGREVVDGASAQRCADASFATRPGQVCAVLTADCLPLLLCRVDGTAVAAVHAGWRGLLAGVIEQAVKRAGGGEWMAWLGPAIGPQAFEVGREVYDAFVAEDSRSASAFVAARPGHFMADLYALARQRLARCGVGQVYGGEQCTYNEPDRFFSYRRDGVTGRMASLIWLVR